MSDITAEWKELRHKIGNFICHMDGINARVDAKLKKLQEKEEQQEDVPAKIDEAYNKGMYDLYDALRIFCKPVPKMREMFGSMYMYTEKIILNNSPEEIIDKVNQWKAKEEQKEQDFHIGDEIMAINVNAELNNRTFIIYEIDDNCYYVIEPITLYKDGFFKNAYIKNQIMKTGKHYDSIPLSEEIK